jgi:hypothetical protein
MPLLWLRRKRRSSHHPRFSDSPSLSPLLFLSIFLKEGRGKKERRERRERRGREKKEKEGEESGEGKEKGSARGSARGSVHWGCCNATALDIEVDP